MLYPGVIARSVEHTCIGNSCLETCLALFDARHTSTTLENPRHVFSSLASASVFAQIVQLVPSAQVGVVCVWVGVSDAAQNQSKADARSVGGKR